MQDFASAAMVRLLVRAMRAHGLEPPAPPATTATSATSAARAMHEPLGRSHVPLEYKRSVVQAVLQHGGLGMLLQLAQRVDLLAGDPVYLALVRAADPPDLIARWQRLERYVHAHHQISVLAEAPQMLHLRHHARSSTRQAPLPAESVAVLGVIMGASRAMGVQGLEVQLLSPAGDVRVHGASAAADGMARADDWSRLLKPLRQPTGSTESTAESEPAPPGPTNPADTENALSTTHRQNPTAAQTVALDLCDALPWPPLAQHLARHVLKDPAAVHTVPDLARHVGQPTRSLQRALAAHGLSCRSVVTEARARAAAQWLLQSPHSLAEIGFACGFADQPHFTREFARHVGMTPARYRLAFAGGA